MATKAVRWKAVARILDRDALADHYERLEQGRAGRSSERTPQIARSAMSAMVAAVSPA
jgi:hypothetical protein